MISKSSGQVCLDSSITKLREAKEKKKSEKSRTFFSDFAILCHKRPYLSLILSLFCRNKYVGI